MQTQLEAQHIIPQELGDVKTAKAYSFTKALKVIKSNDTRKTGIELKGPFKLTESEKKYLKLLPKAFISNRTMQKLTFDEVEVDDILIAEALKAGFGNDKITCIECESCEKVTHPRLMDRMCEGLKERSTAFQLNLYSCSPEFVKPILAASHLKCFSLSLCCIDCKKIGRSVENLIYKGNLYYISLYYSEGLQEDVFLKLGRCLLPKLTKLDLRGTEIPTSALKRLCGSLKRILNFGRSNAFEVLDLGSNAIGSRLSLACFQLLGSDLVGNFSLTVKEDISRAVVKNICSTVSKTKNLKQLCVRGKLSSGTKFKNFNLQEEEVFFNSPFGVNES